MCIYIYIYTYIFFYKLGGGEGGGGECTIAFGGRDIQLYFGQLPQSTVLLLFGPCYVSKIGIDPSYNAADTELWLLQDPFGLGLMVHGKSGLSRGSVDWQGPSVELPNLCQESATPDKNVESCQTKNPGSYGP